MAAPQDSWIELCRALELNPSQTRFVGSRHHPQLGPVFAKLWRSSPGDHWRWRAPLAREAQNLRWLITHGFEAPEPLIYKNQRSAWASLHFEALLTRAIDARDLARLATDGLLSIADLSELGALVARLHRSGFRHRDLFLRNILKTPTGFAFLDCRKGGCQWSWARGALYDLACLDLWLAELLSDEHRRGFFAAYSKLAPLSPARLERINRQRQKLAEDLAQKTRQDKPPRPERRAVRL